MAILDAFKKKKEKEKKPTEKKVEAVGIEQEEKPVQEEKEEKFAKIEKPARGGSASGRKDFSQLAVKIIKSPHLTEKAMGLGQENKYVFKVAPEANKNEIKKAVQELYGVKVEGVNIINIPRKKRRLGKSEGFKPGFKKAVVKVAKGEKIEIGL